MWDASLLIRSIGDEPSTVESSIGYLFGLWTIRLVADESLWTPFQVVPKIRVKVKNPSYHSSFSGVDCEDCLVLTSLSQISIDWRRKKQEGARELPQSTRVCWVHPVTPPSGCTLGWYVVKRDGKSFYRYGACIRRVRQAHAEDSRIKMKGMKEEEKRASSFVLR